MKPWEVKENIGKNVIVNPNRDLSMCSEGRRLIGKTCKLIKQCKSGLLQVSYGNSLYSLPMTNVKAIPKLIDIDFDNEEQVEKLKDQKVEIPVGALAELLTSYYTGGGQPDTNMKRLEEVLGKRIVKPLGPVPSIEGIYG